VKEPAKADAKTAPPASASDEEADEVVEAARAETRGPTATKRPATMEADDEAADDEE